CSAMRVAPTGSGGHAGAEGRARKMSTRAALRVVLPALAHPATCEMPAARSANFADRGAIEFDVPDMHFRVVVTSIVYERNCPVRPFDAVGDHAGDRRGAAGRI